MRIRRIYQLPETVSAINRESVKPKAIKTVKTNTPGFLSAILNNPNLVMQIVVIILTMNSENMQMERRIEGVSSAMEKIKNIAEVLNSTMSSVKVAAETPRKIRQLLE